MKQRREAVVERRAFGFAVGPSSTTRSGSPFATASPGFFFTRKPEAGSMTSSFFARPQPSSIARRPTSRVAMRATTPEAGAGTSRRETGCGSRFGSSQTVASPPCAAMSFRKTSSARPSASAALSRRRASFAFVSRPAARTRSAPRRSVFSRRSAGPFAAEHADRLRDLVRVPDGLAERAIHRRQVARGLAARRARRLDESPPEPLGVLRVRHEGAVARSSRRRPRRKLRSRASWRGSTP